MPFMIIQQRCTSRWNVARNESCLDLGLLKIIILMFISGQVRLGKGKLCIAWLGNGLEWSLAGTWNKDPPLIPLIQINLDQGITSNILPWIALDPIFFLL